MVKGVCGELDTGTIGRAWVLDMRYQILEMWASRRSGGGEQAAGGGEQVAGGGAERARAAWPFRHGYSPPSGSGTSQERVSLSYFYYSTNVRD